MTVIGIVGGMGPEATCDLYLKIIRNTRAEKDQDHFRTIIDSNPKIPDRTTYILGRGPDPRPELIETAKNVEAAGASFIVLPCNTAHYFYKEIQLSVKIPVLHMMDEVAMHLKGKVQRAGIMASTGTIKAGLYEKALSAVNIDCIVPSENSQDKVMKAIYLVKAGEFASARQMALEQAKHLAKAGAQVIIAGCTEIPLILKQGDLEVDIIDATDILAKACVQFAEENPYGGRKAK